MKVVKIHKHMTLHQYGFTVAIRYDNWNLHVSRIEQWIRKMYGEEHPWQNNGPWKTHWGKGRYIVKDEFNREWIRPYFIGFKNEADITAVLLGTSEFQ